MKPANWIAEIKWTGKQVDIADLKPYERNPRTITKDDFERLKRRIQEEGFRAPITVDQNNTILAGHQRWRAAKDLGISKVPVMVPSRELTDDERGQIVVADNVSHGEWDMDILSADFDPLVLAEWGVDMPDMTPVETKAAEEVDDVDGFFLAVETENEADQQDLFAELESRGYKVKIMN